MKAASKRAPRGAMKLAAVDLQGNVIMKDRRGNLHPFSRVRDGMTLADEQAEVPIGTFVDAGKNRFRFQESAELGHKGPAKVATQKYRDEWTRIFGEKTRGGPAN